MSVILGLSGVAFAQSAGPTEQVKQWNAVIGKWVNQEEQRDGPEEPWQKVASEWEIQWLPGGFFVETVDQVDVGQWFQKGDPLITLYDIFGNKTEVITCPYAKAMAAEIAVGTCRTGDMVIELFTEEE